MFVVCTLWHCLCGSSMLLSLTGQLYSRIAVSRGTRLPRDKVEIDALKPSRMGRGDISLLKRHLLKYSISLR